VEVEGKHSVGSQRQTAYYRLLVFRCARRDSQALDELVRTWERRLFYYVCRLVDDEQDAWDILQETWLKVIRGIGSLREPGALPAWLYRIARNTAMSHLRKRYADEALTDACEEMSDARVEQPDFAFEDAARVHEALDQLSPRHREALALCFLEDMSIDEIASVVGIPPGTVKSRLYHARRALREVLEAEEA
jgi:RNA polymerase sigma factor (sigma-70 family)